MLPKSIVAVLLLLVKFSTQQDPIVQLPNGQIRGRQAQTLQNRGYYAFEKIPYAAAPVGPLRFKAPQPATNWDGVRDATYLDISCMQLQGNSESDHEDCLFLNIFTPQLESDGNEPLAVFIYIHGGSFQSGSSMGTGPDLFIKNDVILVTINYRLGPFGFLSTQDDVIPGNNGLKDQRLAFQWTHDNIHLFGGDPDKITIGGVSAGSGSTAYQLLNQDSVGLFRGAILESGCSISPWSLQRNARSAAFTIGAILNEQFQNSDDSNALLEFLQSVSAQDLDSAAEQYLNSVSHPWDLDVGTSLYFAPVLEVQNPDAFITKKAYGLLNAGNVVPVPIIIGYNSEESLLFNSDSNTVQSFVSDWDDHPEQVVPTDMQVGDQDLGELGRRIQEIYTGGKPWVEHLGDAIRFSSDNAFTRSINKFAELFSQSADTYFYQFSYDGARGYQNIHYDGAQHVGHSEELFYFFCAGGGCDLSSFPLFDQITSERLVTMWTNFIKVQDPTPDPVELLQNLTWPTISADSGDFFYLDIDQELSVKNHPKEYTYRRWNELYNSLNYDDFDTY